MFNLPIFRLTSQQCSNKDRYGLANRLKKYTKYNVNLFSNKIYFCFEYHIQTSKQGYTWYC